MIQLLVDAPHEFNDISILAAWSEKIIVRSYFKKCLKDIYEKTQNKKINWLKIGELTVSGHPRHPSRAAYCDFTNFDINKYLMKLK
ncbi:MAG: DUF1643 domain-containing protein [Bacteroidales bacterium]|nr:DUF1643 domain-containing protein [Bacteroidales bacterium]